MEKWIDSCELLTAQELYIPAPAYHLHLVKSVAAWLGLCALLCSLCCAGEYRDAQSGSSCPDAAQSIPGALQGDLKWLNAVWAWLLNFTLCPVVGEGLSKNYSIAPGVQDLWMRWMTVGSKGFVWGMISEKSVILLQTLFVGQKLTMKLMGLVMKPFGFKYFGSCARMLA